MPDSVLDSTGEHAARQPGLASARREHGPAALLAELIPNDTTYTQLREALVRYRAIADIGGWSPIGAGAPLALGAHDARMPALRAHLAGTGDLAATAARGDVFDFGLKRALVRFQARHGLNLTGRLDSLTRAALNVPAAARAHQIALNLERMRWLPLPFKDPFVAVNVPDYTLQVRDSGRVVLRMRVVVGEKRNPTPVFSAAITFIDFNPTWRVPQRILVQEVARAELRDTSYLAHNHMRVFYTHTKKPFEVPHAIVNWYEADQDTFPYIVIQDPGDENPLGRMKFMFPNEYDVYLHDTPSKGFFKAGARDKSHGCIRVERPKDFALFLLQGQAQGVADSVDSIVSRTIPRRIGLKRRVPVHVQYWTAWVDSAGLTQFRDDIYGIDRRLDEAITTGRVTHFVLNPPLEWREDALGASPLTGAARGDSIHAATFAGREAKRWDDSLHVQAKRLEDSLRVQAKRLRDSLRTRRAHKGAG